MIIDGHSHVLLPAEKHLELMNQASVEKTILFSTQIHPEAAETFDELKAEMKRLNQIISGNAGLMQKTRTVASKEQADIIRAYPDRFIGFGAVPLSMPNENALNDYIESQIIANHYIGLGEFTLPSGAIPQLKPIFKAASLQNSLPIWIHAFNPLTLEDIKEIYNLAVIFPKVPVIIGHLGGSNWLETIELVKQTSNLYLDLSAYFSTLVLQMTIQALPGKCIWGVDLPYGDLESSMAAVKKVTPDSGIRRAVLGETIASLLKL